MTPHEAVMRAQQLSRQRAFTLLEVLVALVVLSIGLLGIGKLVLFSSRGNDSAYMRSQATELAYGILDSMRANQQAASAGDYNVGTGAYSLTQNCVPPPAVTCTPAQLVNSDIYWWKYWTSKRLPNGDGTITTNTVTGADGIPHTSATVQVLWNDWVAQQTFGATSQQASVTLETILW